MQEAICIPLERRVYNREGLLHCLDGPAVELENGYKAWYKEGKLHRIGGPALIKEGTIAYYQEGILHRSDGPALIKPDVQAYYFNGKLHRTNGGAIVTNSNTKLECFRLLSYSISQKNTIILVLK